MTEAELLRYLVEVLEALGAEYMIGGSHASIYYGVPRFTRDVDVIVALRTEHLSEFLRRFPSEDFYVEADTARQAVHGAGQLTRRPIGRASRDASAYRCSKARPRTLRGRRT